MSNLEKLKNRDCVLLVDMSGSMDDRDTATGQSRWDYAKETALSLAKKLNEYDPDGITIIPFARDFSKHENVTPEKVNDVFKGKNPGGGTMLAPPLRAVFNDYLARKKADKTKANGEICLVITDGQPQDGAEVKKAIIAFGNQLDNADEEYGISFVQVGHDSEATAYLKGLDDDLTKQGAKHDIVDTKTIDEVEKLGLAETLIAALTD